MLNTESGSLCSIDSTFGGSSLSSLAFSPALAVSSGAVKPVLNGFGERLNWRTGFANTEAFSSFVEVWDENSWGVFGLDCDGSVWLEAEEGNTDWEDLKEILELWVDGKLEEKGMISVLAAKVSTDSDFASDSIFWW